MQTTIEEILNGNVSKYRIEQTLLFSLNDKNFSEKIDDVEEISFINNKISTRNQLIRNGEKYSFSSLYSYDDNGLLKRISRNYDGMESTLSNYFYDDTGRLVKDEYIDLDENQNCRTAVYSYDFDGIKIKFNRHNGSTSSIDLITVENDKIQKISNLNGDGFKVSKEFEYTPYSTTVKFNDGKIYGYNNKGLLVDVTDGNGERIKYFSYEYDEQGNWIVREEREYEFFTRVISKREIVY